MSKKIKWLDIAQHNLDAARKLVERIYKAVQLLAHNEELGRTGRIIGTRGMSITLII